MFLLEKRTSSEQRQSIGQFYTDLSRCRSLKNLSIDHNIYAEDIIINPIVVDFYRSIEAPIQSVETVNMEIPAEYQDAVQELLRKLIREEMTEFSAPKPQSTHIATTSVVSENHKVSHHPDLYHRIIVHRNQTGDGQGEGLIKRRMASDSTNTMPRY